MKQGKYIGNTTNPDKPIWNEYVDERGRSTLEVHTPKKIMESCGEDRCYFTDPDSFGNIQCKRCGRGLKIVWGVHIVKNGKLIKL